jgi:hypothetical protein
MFTFFSENVVYRIKLKYFKEALEKDSAFYDKEEDPTEMGSKIAKECASIQ